MNVRFFGGSKEEYLSIPKHNPLGLYFCADSCEVFLGDKLLSDGIRIISTKCELPDFAHAADGIIYYVVENRTGYVLSFDRIKWLPLFSAPATDMGSVQESDAATTAVSVAALRELERAVYEKIASVENVSGVKAISFAGTELTKVDRVFSIDRETALKALGISITEGSEETDIKELATKDYVDKQIDAIPGTNLTGYATETFVNTKIAESELKDKEAYYTKSEVDARIPDVSKYITESELEDKGYLTEHQDLSGYAKLADLPEDKIFVVDFTMPDFATALEAYNAGKLLLLTNAVPDPNGYAIMNYVREDMITFTKFLMSRSGTYGSFNTYYLHNDNTWELAKEVRLDKVEANVEGEINGELTSVRIGKEIYRIPTGNSDVYTKAEVDALIPEIPENVSAFTNDVGYLTKHQDLSHLATKEDIPDVSKFITKVPDEYITEKDLADEGFLKEQDLGEYAKKDELFSKSYNDLTDKPTIPEIPTNVSAFTNDAGYLTTQSPALGEYAKKTDIEGFATKDDLSSAIENYYTKSEVDAAKAKKADNIPFTDDQYVTKPIGGFMAGDNVNGLTIAAILAKLFELSTEKPGTPGIVESIIANKTPMYAVTDTGAVEPITWSDVLNYTEETAVAKPEVSGFYQITKDDGTVEHGYQQVSAVYNDMPYIIALPKALNFATNVTVQSWNDLESKWIVDDTTKNAMSSDAASFESLGVGTLSEVCPEVDTTKYTIWFLDVGSTGIIYRFIINE